MKKVLILLCALFLTLGCNNDHDDFSSQKGLFVDYISSYTGGVISVGSNIKIRLAKSFPDSLLDEIDTDVFNFSPSIEGKSYFENNNTLVFEPQANLPYDQEYKATVDLGKIFTEIDSDKEEFKFIFQTFIQNYEASIRGFKYYDQSDLSKVKINGIINTADIVTTEDLKKTIEATQNGTELEVSFTTSENSTEHIFTVENAKRNSADDKVNIEIDGTAIGVDKKMKFDVAIPEKGDFQVSSAKIIRGEESYISILFTEPVDSKQNLLGLISLSNTNKSPRLVVDLNEIKVYPSSQPNDDVTLTVNQGIKNINGIRLANTFTKTLEFTQAKPNVKLINNSDKSIIPNSENLVLPFEAIGLKAVDVTIVRIFENNMLQYLQVNSLGGESQLNRVGRPVARKTISLKASGVTDLNKWNRFTLNLEEVFKAEPGAFYQINIGFRKSHSLYFCEGQSENGNMEDLSDNWDSEDQGSYWDYYDSYYSPGYDWSQRDNPCSDSYYGRRRTVSKMLFSSDLGLIAKKRDGGDLSVFVTNLLDTEPQSNVKIDVYDYQQQVIASGNTDSEGKVLLKVEGKPFALVASQENKKGYLKLDDGSALSLSNFNVSGKNVQKGLKGFIYGERGVWRPGDTVHLHFIIEDKSKFLHENHPVIMELYNPAGQLTYKKVSSNRIGPIYRFDFDTKNDAPTGNWSAKAKVGGAVFQKQVKIETIKPNRLKIDLKFDQEKFTADDDWVTADLNVKWLTGATARNLDAEFDLLLRPTNTTFEEFPNYEFDDQSKDFNANREPVFEGTLDNNGYTKLRVELGENKNAPGALNATFYGKVYEEGGNFSISSTSIPYYPYTHFVGIKVPEGDKRGMLLTDKDHKVQIATVNSKGSPVSRKDLTVSVYKLRWRWWWDNSYENISNYIGRSYNEPISTQKISTVNGRAVYNLRVNKPEWGRYFIKVTDKESGHSAGQVVYIDWPGWAGKGQRGELGGEAMLDFAVEKDEYNVGDNVSLQIPSTEGNRLLVSLETGSEILETFWVETESGQTVVEFEATDKMAPNIYAHLTMIQPHGQTENDLPIRLYGVKSIKVVNKNTILEPEIKMPSEIKPQQKFEIKISEKKGKPMAYTIAVVDEGLLDITNFKTPEPWNSFYSREALGIKTWDVYDDVMGAFTGEMLHLLAVGGDGLLKSKDNNEANRFKPVVKVLGPFYLEEGEVAKHNVKMPQYIGSVRTMVIAAEDGAYGHAQNTTPVKQPLMVLATLPRVAGPKEKMKLPVNIFALKNNLGSVNIKVQTSGNLKISGSSDKSVSFTKASDKVIYFDLEATDETGIGKVKVIATGSGLRAEYDIEMNVIARNPLMTDVKDEVIKPGESWSSRYTPLGIKGNNTGSVEISTMPPLNIEQRMNYLVKYPHGCIEQTTSAVFAQLYLDDLTELSSEEEQKIQNNIEAGINKMKSFRVSTGGFAYWPGGNYASNWGTNYAGHFLIEAKKAGYMVPDDLLNSWEKYQKAKARSWGSLQDDNDTDLTQAYRLYTLALAGSPALGAMNRMKENNSLSLAAKWRLALAYAVAGYKDQGKNMITGLSKNIEISDERRYYTFGSRTRDKAMILETLVRLDQKEDAFLLLMDIAKEMGDNSQWMSTQTTAYSFIAIAKYVQGFDIDKPVNAEVITGSDQLAVNNDYFINQVAISKVNNSQNIKINNKGNAPIYARLIRTGTPVEGKEEPSERNIDFEVDYFDLDGNTINPANLVQGTNFTAVVTITNPGTKGDYKDMALTQILPSGWEIINTRLDGSDNGNSKADYIDIRDDRTMHYFDLRAYEKVKFEVLLNAAYRGRFYKPSVKVEAMYDNSVFGATGGEWIEVIAE
ncbi:MG2 domain-containing protein [Mangrovivirga sp. M17]|uniref:MG2 domain-containing protein n=1 Tax=Mangrovivirga halotolerans TaxID=2993936 RepID=A0ABT3RWA5_9BACT|nr:MG2 domain-containing protein [Mangrovivirga halotolerans]MCX2746051.1 MG2 domain-containing protein [Mangrovivirga halotolerans]